MPRLQNLSTKLGLGAASIVFTTLLAAGFLIYGMTQISRELVVTQLAEKQINNFSALASQIDVFAITSANAGTLDPEERQAAYERFRTPVDRTFDTIKDTLAASVDAAIDLGEDEQAQRATQSLIVARMEAQFQSLWSALSVDQTDSDGVMQHLNVFSTQMTPLLGNAFGEEQRRRDNAIVAVDRLKSRLSLYAKIIVFCSITMLAFYYFGLIRPQFSRLSALQEAAREIGQENFTVRLPEEQNDEIGRVMAETNAMSQRLSEQRNKINRDAQRLKEIISERTSELEAANAALEQRDMDRRRFFADISHEMRTPLTVILTEAELAGADDADHSAAFGVIQNRAKRLGRRVDDLLRIARSETGQISVEKEAFSLEMVARTAIEEMESRIKRAGMRVETNLLPSDAFGDGNWTRQIISGLIDNAIRHSGGDTIWISTSTSNGRSIVEVRDNGRGFPDASSVFERFSKAESSPGFGIGLALAKWVVEQQGGSIRVADDLYSVVVELPSTGKAS